MRLTERQIYDALARMPFVDTLELAVTLGEAYSTVHRVLTGLLADGFAELVNHRTVHLPTSGRWFLTSEGPWSGAWHCEPSAHQVGGMVFCQRHGESPWDSAW